MVKEKFVEVVNRLILPLFVGSNIVGEEESTSRDSEVAYGKQNTLLIKPNKNEEYRFCLKRGRAFQPYEVLLLKNIFKEIDDIDQMELENPNFEYILQEKALEKVICEVVAGSSGETMLGIITEMEKWAHRTYEGRNIDFGIVIDTSPDEETQNFLHYSNVFDKDFFVLLSDGVKSYVEFNRDGFVKGYTTLDKVRNYATIAPYEYDNIAKYCGDKRIGIVLTKKSDLLIFKNRNLMFAKRKNRWNVYTHEEVMQLLSYRSSHSFRDVRRSIYLTALDCSFNYMGGILIYLKRDLTENALVHVSSRDILTPEHFEIKKQVEIERASSDQNLTKIMKKTNYYAGTYEDFLERNNCIKTTTLRKIIAGKKFYELPRKLREELVAMDGATIIDFDGTIIAIGAILKIEAGSSGGGGRLAATKGLSKYGVAIKISQDGILQGFCNDKKANAPKQLFIVN